MHATAQRGQGEGARAAGAIGLADDEVVSVFQQKDLLAAAERGGVARRHALGSLQTRGYEVGVSVDVELLASLLLRVRPTPLPRRLLWLLDGGGAVGPGGGGTRAAARRAARVALISAALS